MLEQIVEINWILASFITRQKGQTFAHFESFWMKWMHNKLWFVIDAVRTNLGWKTLIRKWNVKHKEKFEKRNKFSYKRVSMCMFVSSNSSLGFTFPNQRFSTHICYHSHNPQNRFLFTKRKKKCVVFYITLLDLLVRSMTFLGKNLNGSFHSNVLRSKHRKSIESPPLSILCIIQISKYFKLIRAIAVLRYPIQLSQHSWTYLTHFYELGRK